MGDTDWACFFKKCTILGLRRQGIDKRPAQMVLLEWETSFCASVDHLVII